MQQAASARTYLEQRHALLQTVLHGFPMKVNIPSLGTDERAGGDWLLSPDFSGEAVLNGDTARSPNEPSLLSIVDKLSDAVLLEFELPYVSASWYESEHWAWTEDVRHLMLPFGDFNYGFGGEATGFVALDLQTGACDVVSLPVPPGRHAVSRFWFCSTSGSAAVCHLDAASRLAVSVFDSAGAQIRSTPCPEPELDCVRWGPGGQALALQCASALWLWDLAASAPSRVASRAVSVLAWAMPYAGSVVFTQPSSSSPGAAVGIARVSSQPVQACTLQETAGSIISLAWGTCLAVLTSKDESLWATLQVFDLHSSTSSVEAFPAATYSHSPCACVGLAVSSDGELLAAVIGLEEPAEDFGCYDDSDSDTPRTVIALHLMIMHLSTGRLNQWPLWEPLMLGGDLHLRWARDCTAVLVTDQEGCSVLFSFDLGRRTFL